MSDVEIDLDEEFEWVDSDVINEIEDSYDEKSSGTNSATNNVKDIDLYRFISAMTQAEYSFYSKDIDPQNLLFLSENLSSNLSFAKKVAEKFEYELNNLTHLYYFNILLRQISYLSSAASHFGTKIEDILEDQDYIEKVKNTNIEGIVVLENELATNEVGMHIKSVLIPYSIYFENTVGSTFSNISLDWYLDIVIDISKTVATKWNRKVNISKRHLLFISSLDTVARFVLNSLHEQIKIEVQEKLSQVSLNKSTIWDRIEAYGLGLSDYPEKKDILIEKVESLITSELNDFYLINKTIKTLASKDRARLYLIDKLGNTWLEFHDNVISDIQLMNKEEREVLYRENNNLPNFSRLYESIKKDSKILLKEINEVAFDKATFIKNTKQNFSTLWGVSDAYCKTVN
jgi:hypothetical protein